MSWCPLQKHIWQYLVMSLTEGTSETQNYLRFCINAKEETQDDTYGLRSSQFRVILVAE